LANLIYSAITSLDGYIEDEKHLHYRTRI